MRVAGFDFSFDQVTSYLPERLAVAWLRSGTFGFAGTFKGGLFCAKITAAIRSTNAKIVFMSRPP